MVPILSSIYHSIVRAFYLFSFFKIHSSITYLKLSVQSFNFSTCLPLLLFYYYCYCLFSTPLFFRIQIIYLFYSVSIQLHIQSPNCPLFFLFYSPSIIFYPSIFSIFLAFSITQLKLCSKLSNLSYNSFLLSLSSPYSPCVVL